MSTKGPDLLMKTIKRVLESVSKKFEIPFTVADLTQPDEPLVFVNEAFEKLTGYEAKEILGRNCRFLQVNETNPETRQAIRQAINNRKSFWIDILNSKRDGTRFWNRLVMIPFGYTDESIKLFIGIQIAVSQDQAILNSKFSAARSERVDIHVTQPFKNLVDIRRSLKYLQFCEDENEYQQKMEELSDQMTKEVESIINFLKETAHTEFQSMAEAQ